MNSNLTATQIIEYMDMLEYSNAETIHEFMVNTFNIDYCKEPSLVALKSMLEKTIIKSGNWWIEKSI